jgi:hypothetical protein
MENLGLQGQEVRHPDGDEQPAAEPEGQVRRQADVRKPGRVSRTRIERHGHPTLEPSAEVDSTRGDRQQDEHGGCKAEGAPEDGAHA